MSGPSRAPQAAPSSREELLHNAVLFLTDAQVQSSSLASKITFLEGKGLNEDEIQEAIRRARSGRRGGDEPVPRSSVGYEGGGGAAYAHGPGTGDYGYRYGQAGMQMSRPPEPPRRDWRDLFIMTVISGGVVYGLSVLARKYLMPHLQPPSTSSFQQTSSDLSSQFAEADRLLQELQQSTAKLQETLDGDRERVNEVVEGVEEATRLVKEGEERWREEMREVRSEVESLRELVPRLIEKHASTQSSSLSDLSSELRSLKTLLQARQPGPSSSSSSSSAGPHGHTNGITSTQEAANKLLLPKGKGIPAWQMAPSGTASGSGGAAAASGSSSPSGAGSMGSSGVIEDKDAS